MLNILLQAAPAQGGWGNIILLVGIMVVFYFFMIRPQMKRQKEARKFRDSIKKGDSVITLGGVYAKVVEVKEDDIVIIEIADNVNVKVHKSAINADAASLQVQK